VWKSGRRKSAKGGEFRAQKQEHRCIWVPVAAVLAIKDAGGGEYHAPCFVIPWNHKCFRDLATSQIITRSLENLDMKLPEPTVALAQLARK
jgi:hypothetical protein